MVTIFVIEFGARKNNFINIKMARTADCVVALLRRGQLCPTMHWLDRIDNDTFGTLLDWIPNISEIFVWPTDRIWTFEPVDRIFVDAPTIHDLFLVWASQLKLLNIKKSLLVCEHNQIKSNKMVDHGYELDSLVLIT